jgi:hypothetical protein
MGPLYYQNEEQYTKNPIDILNKGDSTGIQKLMILSDGRILFNTKLYFYVFNKDNYKKIDIQFKNTNQYCYPLCEISNRIIIDNGSSLIELKDRMHRTFIGLKDTTIGTALKLSNGLIVVSCYENNNATMPCLIHFCELNKKEKKLKIVGTIKLNNQLIIDICQINSNMIMVYGGDTYGSKRILKFYDIKNKILITEVIQSVIIDRLFTYPKMFGNDLLLVGNKNKVDIFNVNKAFTLQSIKTCDKYVMNRFLILNENHFICGDNAGNIYVFEVDKENIKMKNKFKAHEKLIEGLEKYKDNIIITCSQDDAKFWEIL